MEQQEENELSSTPPYFKSWKSIYLVVLGNLTLMILLMYLFSNSYN